MKYAYDSAYFPAAPHVEIWLAVPDESFKVGPLLAFVDTGADATIVPLNLIHSLPVQVDDRKILRSPLGDRRVVDVYLLDVGIADARLPVIEIVADQVGHEIIVGRNVLNKLRMTLDGPKQTVDVSVA
jgi:predicted aspartyl protease